MEQGGTKPTRRRQHPRWRTPEPPPLLGRWEGGGGRRGNGLPARANGLAESGRRRRDSDSDNDAPPPPPPPTTTTTTATVHAKPKKSDTPTPARTPSQGRKIRRRLCVNPELINNQSCINDDSDQLQIDDTDETRRRHQSGPPLRAGGGSPSTSTPNKRGGSRTPSTLEQEVAAKVKRLRACTDDLLRSSDEDQSGEEMEDEGADQSPLAKSSSPSLYSEIVQRSTCARIRYRSSPGHKTTEN